MKQVRKMLKTEFYECTAQSNPMMLKAMPLIYQGKK